MLEDKEALVIVKVCLMLSQMMEMKVVAEGIENKAIWDKLKILGCDIGQGYYIAKPMPAKKLYQWVKNNVKQKL